METILNDNETRLCISEQDMSVWFSKAKPGDAIEYYRGHLWVDIDKDATTLKPKAVKAAKAIGKYAMELSRDGWAHLVQRKHGAHDYSYLAVFALPNKS